MADPIRTPITLESLVALGGTIEDGVNVRFGKEIAYQAGKAWHLGYQQFLYVEDLVAWLMHYGASIGFKGVES